MRIPTTTTAVGGAQSLYKFDNNYGASVIQTGYTSQGQEGLYELAVVLYEKDDTEMTNFDLVYDTPITEDVVYHLREQDVDKILDQIEGLPCNI